MSGQSNVGAKANIWNSALRRSSGLGSRLIEVFGAGVVVNRLDLSNLLPNNGLILTALKVFQIFRNSLVEAVYAVNGF